MRSILLSILFVSLAVIVTAQERDFLGNVYKYIENTQVFELNQEEGHTPLVPYLAVNAIQLYRNSVKVKYLVFNLSFFESNPSVYHLKDLAV